MVIFHAPIMQWWPHYGNHASVGVRHFVAFNSVGGGVTVRVWDSAGAQVLKVFSFINNKKGQPR
jgi:hypothetical protein